MKILVRTIDAVVGSKCEIARDSLTLWGPAAIALLEPANSSSERVTDTFNFLPSANEVTLRSCKEESHFLKAFLRFFFFSGSQAAVAPDVTGIADRGLVLARIPNEVGESSSKAFDHPVIPEPAQNKVLAGTALSVLL